MAQKLIVEGKDAIVLAQLCHLCGLNPPLGYESAPKFKKKFVSDPEGYDKAILTLGQAIRNPEFTNIGIIVDANEKGALARWQSIRGILAEIFSTATLETADAQPGAKIIQEEKLPTIGVWIMPDNSSNGYLEHFLASLVPQTEELWAFAQQTLETLQDRKFNELTKSKYEKALLHTWLAWKKEPGKPFGQAMASKYFDIAAPTVAPFINWFRDTFQLS